MRSIFPAYFRPSEQELDELWQAATFAVDANVLLNLYRYSPATREELEQALDAVKSKLFLPHQAAKEFLSNRLSVTSDQSREYATVSKSIEGLLEKLENRKRHPFVSDGTLKKFSGLVQELKLEL